MKITTTEWQKISIEPNIEGGMEIEFTPSLEDVDEFFRYLNVEWGSEKLYKKVCELFDSTISEVKKF